MIILTVLRSGGDFKPEHVVRLYDQWNTWGPVDSSFMCLTDMELPSYICAEKLQHSWPGWWSKMEAFTIPGPVLYMDLDTSIVGPIGDLCSVAAEHEFTGLLDFFGQGRNGRELGSGLMAWSGDMSRVYGEFELNPHGHMRECKTPQKWGDQGFIQQYTEGRKYWQRLLPGQIVSWKAHCKGGIIPDEARVVCFHGKPRPWDVGQ